MYNIRPTTKFQKDLKRVKKRGFDISLLTDIIKKLAAGEPLPEKNREHQLSGDYTGCRECHITPDWLLIYEVDGDELILYLTRTGSHSRYSFPIRQTMIRTLGCSWKVAAYTQGRVLRPCSLMGGTRLPWK